MDVHENGTLVLLPEEIERAFFDNAPSGKSVTTPAGQLLRVNRSFGEMLGYTTEELQALAWQSISHPDDDARTIEGIRDLLAGKVDVWTMEKRYFAKGGRVVWAEVITRLQRDAVGEPQFLLADILDISEHKRVEQSLMDSEERFAIVFHNNALPMLISSATTAECVEVNTTFLRYAGFSREEILGRTVSELGVFHTFGYKKPLSAEFQVLGAVYSLESSFRLKSGDVRDCLILTTVIQLRGEPHFYSTLIDVTEQKRAERMLVESERKLREAQRLGQVGSWEFDLATQTLTWSDETFRLYERNPALGPPSLDEEASYYEPEQAAALRALARRAIEQRESGERELEAVLPSGDRRNFEAKVQPIFDSSERTVRIFGTVHDITERKQAEAQVRRQTAVTEAINRILLGALQVETDTEVALLCLGEAESLTSSRFGWIGELNPSGRLDSIAVSNLGLHVVEGSDAEPATIRDLEVRGIFGHALKDGRSLFTNEPGAHPDRVGFPFGYPELTAFLGVPLRVDGRTVGLIALGNKPSGYTLHDQESIEALTVAFLEALARKRGEKTLADSEEKFARAFQTAPYAISITRPEDGRFIEVNDAFTSVAGLTREEALADSSVGLKLWVNEADRQHVLASLREGQAVINQEYRFRTRRGEIIVGLFSAKMIHLSIGTCILSSINDITAQVQTKAELEQQLDEMLRWQDVMLDREDRMHELKREVNELCRRAGEPPRYPSQESIPAAASVGEKGS